MGSPQPAGRADTARHKVAQRRGRERGCWVYISAEALAGAGLDLDGPPPEYRLYGGGRRSVIVQLYGKAPAADAR